jgi:hypothetical protein
MHPGHRFQAKRLRRFTDLGAGQSVAAGVEGRASNHHIGPQIVEMPGDRRDRLGALFADVVVATDERAEQCPLRAEHLL